MGASQRGPWPFSSFRPALRPIHALRILKCADPSSDSCIIAVCPLLYAGAAASSAGNMGAGAGAAFVFTDSPASRTAQTAAGKARPAAAPLPPSLPHSLPPSLPPSLSPSPPSLTLPTSLYPCH